MELIKRENESDFDYHKRLIEGKLEDKTLSDIDYSELSEFVYGRKYSSDVARRMMYGSKRTLDILGDIDSECVFEDESIIDGKITELKKERQKIRDERSALNKIIREDARRDELKEIIVDTIRSSELQEFKYEPAMVECSSNDLLVSLNDIHYGLEVNNFWTNYNPDVCKEMMYRYIDKIKAIALTHGSENCYVFNCGDSISGKIHLTVQLSNKENVVKQIIGVSELIATFLTQLSKVFKYVTYISVPGNHSRLDTKDNSPYDERLDDIVEWWLAERLYGFDNIVLQGYDKLDNSISVADIRDKSYCFVHGDFDCSETKLLTLKEMVGASGKNVYAVCMGHTHANRTGVVSGVKTLVSGSFVGVDDYCIQKRLFGRPEQLVCVCDKSGIVCTYDVSLRD